MKIAGMAASDNDREQLNLSLDQYLPEHLVLLCLVRVPLSSYQIMRRVCRAWRRMLKETQFWKARDDQNVPEQMVFLRVLCTHFVTDVTRGITIWEEIAVWHAFFPLSNTWIQVPAMPEDGRDPTASAYATLDKKLFVIGGKLKDSGLSCTTVSYFHIGQNCWKLGAPLNTPRSKCKVGIIANKLYVFGGFTENPAAAKRRQDAGVFFQTAEVYDPGVFLQTAEVYDPVVESWRLVSNIKIPAQIDYSIALDEKFLAIGTSGKNLTSVQIHNRDWTELAGAMGTVYDPQKNEWRRMAHGLMHRWPSKTVEVNGRLYGANNCYTMNFYNSSKVYWQPVEIKWERSHLADVASEGIASSFSEFYMEGKPPPDSSTCHFWRVELLNLGGKICMIGLQERFEPHAMAVVLDMEEHLSATNDIRIQAKVVIVEKITEKIRALHPGFLLRLKDLLSCQAI